MIKTLTIKETVSCLREHGMSISTDSLAAGLEQGVFPFGSAFRTAEGRSRCVYIYKALLDRWIAERETEERNE